MLRCRILIHSVAQTILVHNCDFQFRQTTVHVYFCKKDVLNKFFIAANYEPLDIVGFTVC